MFNNHMPFTDEVCKIDITLVNTLRMYCTPSLEDNSLTQDIDIGGRKYVAGESGRAEMCDMFCRTLGRGHIHISPCDSSPSTCTHAPKDGRRHETCRYGPDEHVPKDELTHENHWATVGWEDPCSAAERKVRLAPKSV